MVAVQKVN